MISCRLLNSSLAVRSKSNRICETLSSRSFPFLRMANEIQATLKGLLITFFAGTSNLLSTFLLSNYTRIIQGTILIEKKKKKKKRASRELATRGKRIKIRKETRLKKTNERCLAKFGPRSAKQAILSSNVVWFQKAIFVMLCPILN